MKKLAVFAAVALFSLSVNAELINFSGKIVKEGTTEGVAGARISLKKFFSVSHIAYSPVVFYSGTDGSFKMARNTGTLLPIIGPGMSGISLRSTGNGSGFHVQFTGSKSPVSIDIFRLDGRRIATRRLSASNGSCFVPLAHSVSTQHLVRISMNHESRMFKSVPGIGIACSMVTGNASDPGRLGKQTASISDSIVVIKEGFRTACKAVQTYDLSGITISLTPSQTWNPAPGTLLHQGGMVKIMAKSHDFEMGQPCDTARGIYLGMPTTDYEQPVHTVSFTHDFWMDTVEVQQGIFDSLMRKTYPSFTGGGWSSSNGMGKSYAVYTVVWGDCALFCNARSKCEGLPDTAYSYSKIIGRVGNLCTLKNVKTNFSANAYRLPTEAEWEYAARGGTTTDYYWGKNQSDLKTGADTAEVGTYAVWYANSFGLGRDTTEYGAHVTGKLKPNKYGLYDMLGNVSEWCNDWYDDYKWGPVTDPTGPDSGEFRAEPRGGNWGNSLPYLRVTERSYTMPDYPYFFEGFRVVKQIN
jgi:formylglycine-generating enzyme required for sulfatase activity